MTLEPGANKTDRAVDDLWRTHDFLADELRERRSRAASLFGVAALSLVTLLAAALTTSIGDLSAMVGWFPTFFEAVLAYSAFVAAVALLATNPGLPWERGSVESIGYLLSRLLRVPAKGLRGSDPFERAPGYRYFLAESLGDLPLTATAMSAANLGAEDLAIQIRARSLQLNQLRVWRRPLTVLLGLDLVATTGATLLVVSLRLGTTSASAALAIALGLAIGLVILLLLASISAPRGTTKTETSLESNGPGRARRDPLIRRFPAPTLVGGVLAAGFFAAGYVLGAPATPESAAVLQTGLLLTGLLFVPASIFVPVMGAMFPNYWNATPVALIRLHPLQTLLSVLVGTITYGVVATGLGLIPVLRGTTWMTAFPMVWAVAVGAYRAAQLVSFSLSVFDPIWLAEWLATEGAAAGGGQAFADLCRLLRGMIERHRRDVALHIIELLSAMAERGQVGSEDHRDLARRVLNEADKKWNGPDIHEATAACRRALSDAGLSTALPPPLSPDLDHPPDEHREQAAERIDPDSRHGQSDIGQHGHDELDAEHG